MTYTYTLSNNQKISMDIWPNLLGLGKKVCYRDQTCTGKESTMKTLEVLMDPDSKEMFFELDGELKSFADFDYLPLDELIKKIHKGALTRGEITRDQFVATLLKESGNIGFVFPAYEHGPVRRIFGLVENEESSRDNWANKITLRSGGLMSELYTSDIFRDLCAGNLKLVNINPTLERQSLGRTLAKILNNIKNPRGC